MRGRWTVAVLLVALGACRERAPDAGAAGADPGAAVAATSQVLDAMDRQDSVDAANPYARLDDPCILLGAADVEAVIGSLRTPPWRSGSSCHYAATDGQQLDLDVYYSGALLQAGLMNAVQREAAKGLVIETGRGLDTLDGRWDAADWRMGDYLETRRGDVGITVQMGNTLRPDPAAAARLADLAYARLDQPLEYDGGSAEAPPPVVPQGDPCALLTSAEVAARAGRVEGEPVHGGDGSTTWCTWRVAGKDGRGRELTLSVTWTDGFTEMNTKAGALQLYRTNVEKPELGRVGGEEKLRELMRDPAGAKAMGAMRDVMRQGGAELEDSSLMARTDGDVKGPWSRGVLLAGDEFLAVSKGVCLRIGLAGIGYEGAKALVAAAAGRL